MPAFNILTINRPHVIPRDFFTSDSITAICCGFVVQVVFYSCAAAVDKISTEISRRAVRLRWESFLLEL